MIDSSQYRAECTPWLCGTSECLSRILAINESSTLGMIGDEGEVVVSVGESSETFFGAPHLPFVSLVSRALGSIRHHHLQSL